MSVPLTRYPQEAEWFDDNLPIRLESPFDPIPGEADPVEAVFGRAARRRLSPLSLLHFAGAYSGSTVYCWAGSWDGIEPATPTDSVLYLRVIHPEWIVPDRYNQIRLFRNESGNPEMFVDQVYLRRDAAPRGLGTLTFWRMVRAAQLTGFANIRLAAAGGRLAPPVFGSQRWDGYRFWPSLGFDGALTNDDRQFFRENFWDHPKGIHAATTVQQVLTLEGGAAFWKYCGGSVPKCTFATGADTMSMKILSAYVDARYGVRS